MFKNFDFSWFLTIPGILTGVGCLLVIISIIIFISTIRSKKTKDSENDVNVVIPDQGVNSVPIDNNGNPLNVVNDASTNVVDNQLPLTSGIDQISVIPVENNMATDVQPVELTPVNMEPEIQPVEVAPINVEPQIQPVEVAPMNVEPQIQPVEVAPMNVEPQIQPVEVAPMNVEPQIQPVEVAPMNVEPQIQPVELTPVNMEPEIQPVEVAPMNVESQIQPVEVAPISVEPQIQPVEVAPISVEPQLQPVEPAINNNVQVDAVNLPYGGVSPNVSVPIENPQQEKIIYGGADPLAGTGVIPVVQPQQTETSKTEEIEAL
ncbi:MAG: hypothetical protein IJ501_06945 [Bacilli bacterium]|nr:hypothetical protein [Bacilli bacterium]